MNEERKAILEIHTAVILFGFTAILGSLITLPAITLVWWRVLITSISLLYFIRFGKKLKGLQRKDILKFLGIGAIVGMHWICFYGSVKLANASVALICMATTTLFTSIIEPLVGRRPISRLELLIGFMIIPGMIIIVQDIDTSLTNGFIVGILSALLAATFATLNKLMVSSADSYSITFLEITGAWIFLSLLFLINVGDVQSLAFMPAGIMDWVYLMILALLCTTLAYVLSLNSLKHMSAFANNLVINLEPIYGILLAAVILKEYEQLNLSFYIGATLIVMTVFAYPILNKKLSL